ncbi:MAG TPA: entericidin A [Anaerohalosphaeraceae bacterium]|jgi:predicted small secreted protein|nr:entericidin A [Anaerohalosphaeraceae bacterium]HRT51269.1 entericidin A [Anaerohalosphaeraceae bacterium]HRT87764.1 entericidin A [Anaerohalosphaeraceae bacterium]
MLRKVLLIIVLAMTVLSLTGCQTIQGLGRDITWLAGGDRAPVRR